LQSKATTNVTIGGNLTSSLPVGQALTTTATVFDSLGAAHDVAISFTNTGPGSWNMSATYVDATGATTPPIALGAVTFDAAGNLTSPSPTTMGPLTFGSGNPQTVSFALDDPMHAFSQYDRASTIDAPVHDGSAGA
jgi:flagellar hook protein FlgE